MARLIGNRRSTGSVGAGPSTASSARPPDGGAGAVADGKAGGNSWATRRASGSTVEARVEGRGQTGGAFRSQKRNGRAGIRASVKTRGSGTDPAPRALPGSLGAAGRQPRLRKEHQDREEDR